MAKAKKEELVAGQESTKAKDQFPISLITEAFEKRFDYQSARTVLKEGLTKLGLGEKDQLTREEVQKLIDIAPNLEENMAVVVEALNALLK